MYKLVIIFFLFGCAKPNYRDPKPPAPVAQQKPDGDAPVQEACDLFFTQSRLCVELTWEKNATQTEPGVFKLKFFIQETPAQPVDPRHTPFVQLWMTSMGHGSSPVTVEKVSEGIYKATRVFFIMPGEWDIRLQLKDGKNVVEQVIKKITI